MRKIGSSTLALTTRDWMKYRPYRQFTSYDGHYLKLANSVFEHLNQPQSGLREVFQRDHLKEMAILLTCHFEDFINDIGLWRALVRRHEALYGRVLPFFDLEGYDPDYLNPQDFAYLLWHHLGKMANKILHPFAPVLLNTADFCYEFFEARIETAPATDFYENWLDINPDIHFFELKHRLAWMTFENYLTGPENSALFQEDLSEMMEKDSRFLQEMDPGKIVYAQQEEYLYRKRTSWCALSSAEWLADVVRCPESLRADIRRLNERVSGYFLYEGCDKEYYHFRFIRTNRLFHVRRSSIDLETARMEPGSVAGVFGAVDWQGEWWLSGTYMAWDLSPRDLEKQRASTEPVSFYSWTLADQHLIRTRTAEMEAAFLEYFGDRLLFSPDQNAAAEALREHNIWWNAHKDRPAGKRPVQTRNQQHFSLKAPDSNKQEGLSIYFEPGEGVSMSPVIPRLARWLTADELPAKDSIELFQTFFMECSNSLARLLVERYSGKNLRFPLINNPGFVAENFEFFLRYYHPGAFREVVPNLVLAGRK